MPRSVRNWITQDPKNFISPLSFTTWAKKINPQVSVAPEHEIATYLNEVIKPIDQTGLLPVLEVTEEESDEFVNKLLQRLSMPNIDKFGLSVTRQISTIPRIELEGKRLTRVHLRSVDEIVLKNCQVVSLDIGGGNYHTIQAIELWNCNVGTFRINSAAIAAVRRIEIFRGEIVQLRESPGAILGPVTLRNLRLPTKESSLQALRNLQEKLIAIHNLDAAGVVNASDLRISRRKQNFSDRLISYIYDLGSEYGTRTSWPIYWVVVFALANIDILLATQGTALVPESDVGWREALAGDSKSAVLLRAIYLTLGQVFNPLSVFGVRNIVVTTEPWIAALSIVLCLFGTISIGLFVLAVRRRFRVGG